MAARTNGFRINEARWNPEPSKKLRGGDRTLPNCDNTAWRDARVKDVVNDERKIKQAEKIELHFANNFLSFFYSYSN